MKKALLSLLIVCIFCLPGCAQYQSEILVETLLKTDTTVIGQKIIYPQFENDEVTMSKVTIPQGKSTGWHKHSIPVFAYVLQGTLTVELENGTINTFSKNKGFSEVINTYHNGTNLEAQDVILIAFYLGEKGKPLSVKKE